MGTLGWDDFLLFADRDRSFSGSRVCVWKKERERIGSAPTLGSVTRKGLVARLIMSSWMFSHDITLHKCLTI